MRREINKVCDTDKLVGSTIHYSNGTDHLERHKLNKP